MKGVSRIDVAARAARDIPDGSYVNLGIGLPMAVAGLLPADREIVLHTENGMLGMGPAPAAGEEDPDIVNAGKQPVTLRPGGSYFHQADSFAMIRGGHLDLALLGGYQVSASGDLANWRLPGPKPPAVGGAMDLVVGARAVWVLLPEHCARDGSPRVVERCTLPLTGTGCVKRIYSNLAVIDVTPEGLRVTDLARGVSFEELQGLTGAPLRRGEPCRELVGAEE